MNFRTLVASAVLSAGLVLALAPGAARAMPLQKIAGVDAPIEKVWGGCGPHGHRGPWGGCRRGGQWGGWGWRRPYWRRW
ncbi:hypothetical protein WOB59_12620 [Methylocystis sp. IM4]|uniref:GCG_CRPN prefix-to-repeats domain-containing protein n=1 Tax=Methylocystis sp. IM4 TaxID=3136560 RepID=UPI0031192369